MSFIHLIEGKVTDVKDKTAKGYDIQEVKLDTDARIIVLFNQKAVKVGGKFKVTNLMVKEFRGIQQLNLTRKSILEFDSTPPATYATTSTATYETTSPSFTGTAPSNHVHLYICGVCGDKATFPQ